MAGEIATLCPVCTGHLFFADAPPPPKREDCTRCGGTGTVQVGLPAWVVGSATGVMNPQSAAECAMCAHIAARDALEAETGLKARPLMFKQCPAHPREPEADTPTVIEGSP